MTPRQSLARLLKVAIVGGPNAGKSTLLNKLVEKDISCVSKKPHTTIRNCLGILTSDEARVEFYDSPGLVSVQHAQRHHLKPHMLEEPERAVVVCDMIALVVDISNPYCQRSLPRMANELLRNHEDKMSILIMNKIDLIKEKRRLLDLGIRLTQGCLKGQCVFTKKELEKMPMDIVAQLNLRDHLGIKQEKLIRKKKDYVIELDPPKSPLEGTGNQEGLTIAERISFKNFSQIFSISALENDGVDILRRYFFDQAKHVPELPAYNDSLTHDSKRLAHEIIRGRILDHVPGVTPHLVRYRYTHFEINPETGELEIHLLAKLPDETRLLKFIGEKGVNVYRIVEDSQDLLSKLLGREVVLKVKAVISKRAPDNPNEIKSEDRSSIRS